MRPLFAIKLVAGLTLGLALMFAASQVYGAVICSRAIRDFKYEGPELEKWQRDYEETSTGAARSVVLAALQATILIYARKINAPSRAAS